MRLLEKYPSLRDHVMSAEDVVIVDITSAANWYWEDTEQTDWDLARDFHSLTPPSRATYMEYTPPAFANFDGSIQKIPEHLRFPIGCIVGCHEIPEDEREKMLRLGLIYWYANRMQSAAMPGSTGVKLNKKPDISTNQLPRFLLIASILIPAHISTVVMYLDDTGKAFEDDSGYVALTPARTLDEADRLSTMFYPFALALSLMNCKNVELIEDQRHLTRSQRRRMVKSKTPQTEYKWLHIKQLQRRVTQDAISSNHTEKRLHFVRAHWATYSADGPLFGKYTGTFFKPQHIRGNAAVGEVVKGYKVDAP